MGMDFDSAMGTTIRDAIVVWIGGGPDKRTPAWGTRGQTRHWFTGGQGVAAQ